MKYPGRALRFDRPNDPAAVREIQAQLNDFGCGPVDVDGQFGPGTLAAVKLFQTRNDLEADGIVGPATWTLITSSGGETLIKAGNDLQLHALRVAKSYIGVREHGGANRGKEVEMFLASVGLGPGHAWCMSFGFYCFQSAAMRLGITNPLVKTGRVLEHWKKAPRECIVSQDDAIENHSVIVPGALFMIDHGEGKGHTGLVESVMPGVIQTIEGNTNKAGSREGDGVYEKTRPIRSVNLGFVDYSRLLAP